MRVLVVGGIYKTPEMTLDGGITIAKIFGTYSDYNIDYFTQFSTNEQKLTKRIKNRLATLGINTSHSSSVSINYGNIDATGITPNTNSYPLSESRVKVSQYSLIVVSTDIDQSGVRQILTHAHNANIPSIVFTNGEYHVPDAPNRTIIHLENYSYESSHDQIKEELLMRGYIGSKPIPPKTQSEVVIDKIKSIYVLPRLVTTGFVLLIGFLSVMWMLNYFSEQGEYPTDVNWNQTVNHEMCDTIESCADYGNELIDEIEDHINLLADPYVFHENRSTTNYITYDIVDGEATNAEHHNDLPFGDEARFLSVWERYHNIIPADYHDSVDRFRLFSDGEGSRVAYVSISEQDTFLAVDIRDNHNRSQLYRTLIHEFAHIYSLPIDDFTCNSTAMSCLKDDALLNDYMQRFWTHYDENWYDNTNKPMPQREAFYNNNFSDFYIPYQATNVKEDYAVTFVQFIIRPRPINPVQLKDIKVESLYEDPELVLMRLEILQNILALEASE